MQIALEKIMGEKTHLRRDLAGGSPSELIFLPLNAYIYFDLFSRSTLFPFAFIDHKNEAILLQEVQPFQERNHGGWGGHGCFLFRVCVSLKERGIHCKVELTAI